MDTKINPKFSETISEFLALMENARSDYQWNCEQVKLQDELTQDYLHSLELDGLTYKQRAKVATQLALCRQRRREHKDMAASLEPLVIYLDGEKGRQMMNLMREVLGKTRKIEQYMENRKYINRVLDPKEAQQ